MRYEDASHTGAFQGSQPIANDDLESLAAGSRSAASGNLITGEGTQTGSAGADSATGAHITAIAGKSGEDTSFSGGKLSVSGEHGKLSVDAEGNYIYQANAGVENVRDRFTYTLADNNGATDTASLIVEIGKTPVVIKADAQQVVPGPDGVVTLPPGVELSDVRVVGRDLVIDLPDGSQMIIVDGAIFVPQLVLDGVEVPSTNLAALLIGQEPQPAAGELPQSSGGNFDVLVPPLDPGVPLGDLIPPTEYTYTPPEPQEVLDELDRDPEIFIQPDGQPASVAAVDSVDEDGLPARNGNLPNEPSGSDEGADGNPSNNSDPDETTGGVIIYDSPDGVASITINNIVVSSVGQVINGTFGVLTITSIADGQIGYSYTLTDNTSGDATHDDFSVVLTDEDGDQASATLTINIVDDVPTARNDTDASVNGVATGNVMTDAAPGDVGDSDTNAADTVGADNATLTAVSGAGGSDSTFSEGLLSVNGQFGSLTIDAQGNYTYTVNPNAGGGGVDVFTYTLTDGDGDTSTATLTITNPDLQPNLPDPAAVLLDDDALANGNPGGTDDDVDSSGTPGVLVGTGGDGDLDYAFAGPNILPAGFTVNTVNSSTLQILQGGTVVLTVTLNTETGAFTVVQNNPIDHAAGLDENNISFGIGVQVVDADGDVEPATITINVDDDTPEMNRADVSLPTLTVDETNLAVNASADYSVIFAGAYGADGAGTTSYAVSVVNGTDSGLVDVATGQSVLLYNIGGVVTGSTAASLAEVNAGNTVFTVSVDSGTGVVSLDQVRAVSHPDASDADDPVSPAATSIQLTATITDADGDPASLQVNIGSSLVFEDDGPSISPGAAEPTLVVDESDLTVNHTLSFVDAFVAAFGADGPAGTGSISYSLGINAGATGLVDTATGLAVVLSVEGGMVVGRAGPGGAIVFTVGANASGDVTLDQQRSVRHADSTNPDDSISLATDDLITITGTATDRDGDTASVTIGIGRNLVLEDDGPSAANDVDTIVGGNGPATGNLITGVDFGGGDANSTDGTADNVGADTPGSITAIASVNVPGNLDTDPSANFVIQGEFGVLTLNANGDYSYLRTSEVGGVEDVFTYTLTDGDGDSVTATLTIGIDDNFPTLPDPALIRLDDDVIPGANGIVDGPGDDDPDAVPGNVVNGQLNGSGGDAPLTYNFTGTNTLPAGFSVGAGSDADTLLINQGGTLVMTIQLNQATGAFTVTQNAPMLHLADNGGPEDNIENNFNFSIGVEVEDADGDVEGAAITINVDDDTPTINVTEGSDAAVILTTDDAQTIGGASDTAQSTANFSGVFGLTQSAGADGTAAAATLSYILDVTGFAGGPAGVNSGLESHDADIFLYEIGGKVVGSTSATLAGVDAGNTVFDVAVNGSGVVTLTQYQQVDHDTADPTPTGPGFADHIVSLADGLITLTASSSLTDNDGDTVTDSEVANIGANLQFTDDGPNADTSGTAVGTVTLDETRGEGTDTAGGSAPSGDASATIDFSVNFVAGGSVNYGADGPGSVAYALQLTGSNVNSGLFALDGTDTSAGDGDGYGQGAQIVLNISGNTVTGSVGGTNYFTLTIDPGTGIVTFTQINPIWHPTAGTSSFDEAATLTTLAANLLRVVQTVTDFDGDTDTAEINIGQGVFIIQDDGPQAIQSDAASLENEAGASVTADLDDDLVDSEVISDFGEDLPGLVQFANIGPDGHPSGLTSNDDPIEYWLSNNGQTLQARTNSTNGTDGQLIFTVQINQATGDYTVTMTGTIDNGAGVTFDNLTSTKAGNVDVRGVGADDPLTTVDLLLTASSNGANATINTSAATVGSANQSMDQGETIRIDFVSNLEDDPADDLATFPSGFSYDGHVGTQSYLQFIPQVQGSQGETVAFRVYALNSTVTDAGSPDDTPVAGPTPFSDSTVVAITHVTVDGFDDGPDDGTPNQPAVTVAIGAVGVWTSIAYGVFAQLQADGSVIFTGIQEGDQYGIETGTDFNAVAVSSLPTGIGPVGNLSTTNSFDLGVFSIGRVDSGDPIDISFDLSITDADGDTIALPGAIDITFEPAVETLAATSFSSQEEQLQKSAANSNTLSLAAAVAAAGLAESAAATPSDDAGSFDQLEDSSVSNSSQMVEELSADDGDAGTTLVDGTSGTEAADGPGNSSGHGQGNANGNDGQLDAGASQQASDEGASHQAANDDQGPAEAVALAVAPAVGMPSAEALLAAGLTGDAKQGGSVEQIVAEALGEGGAAATVDAILDALAGANGNPGAIAELASPPAAAVPAWDMAPQGAFGGGADMMFNGQHVAIQHHDAVQPVVNG